LKEVTPTAKTSIETKFMLKLNSFEICIISIT